MGSVWVESRTSGRMQCLCVNICVCMYVYILHVCVRVCICAWEQLKKKKEDKVARWTSVLLVCCCDH